jgi:hypothetical protein
VGIIRVNDHHAEEELSTPRFGALLGLALGAIWAVAGFGGAALAGLLTAVGYLAALVQQGRLDLTRLADLVDHERAAPATQGAAPATQTESTRPTRKLL